VSASLAYLLDTNILSDLVRNPQGVVARQITRAGENTICTSIIAAAELRYGAIKSNSARLAERIDLILSALEVLPLETPADRMYASLRDHLPRHGTPIGPNDLLIAAHALANDLTVITANVGEFSRVPGLKVENWLQNQPPSRG
jgi:tRNA(fMet)-specific endonuclease VapC